MNENSETLLRSSSEFCDELEDEGACPSSKSLSNWQLTFSLKFANIYINCGERPYPLCTREMSDGKEARES
jgi:hypothetical protein